MRIRALWEVCGPAGHFDASGNFVPTEKFGVMQSLFMNIVVLPMVIVYMAYFLGQELLPRGIANLFERMSGTSVHH